MEFILKALQILIVFIPIAAIFPIWFYATVFVMFIILDTLYDRHINKKIKDELLNKIVKEEVYKIIKEERSNTHRADVDE